MIYYINAHIWKCFCQILINREVKINSCTLILWCSLGCRSRSDGRITIIKDFLKDFFEILLSMHPLFLLQRCVDKEKCQHWKISLKL